MWRSRFLVALLCLAHPPPLTAQVPASSALADPAPWEDFEDENLLAWKTTELSDRATLYRRADDNGSAVLSAVAMSSASLFWRALDDDLETSTQISWRWRIEAALDHGISERHRDGDDYVARLFVVFGEPELKPGTRAICYVWAASQPPGSIYPSPYADDVVTIVLQSGNRGAGQWLNETRDFAADYRNARGIDPGPPAAVAVMVDTDNTGGRAAAWFDDFYLR